MKTLQVPIPIPIPQFYIYLCDLTARMLELRCFPFLFSHILPPRVLHMKEI